MIKKSGSTPESKTKAYSLLFHTALQYKILNQKGYNIAQK